MLKLLPSSFILTLPFLIHTLSALKRYLVLVLFVSISQGGHNLLSPMLQLPVRTTCGEVGG